MVIHSHSSVPQVKQFIHIGYAASTPDLSKPFVIFLFFGLLALKLDDRICRAGAIFLLGFAALMGLGLLIG